MQTEHSRDAGCETFFPFPLTRSVLLELLVILNQLMCVVLCMYVHIGFCLAFFFSIKNK